MPQTTDLARKVILSPNTKRFVDLNTDLGQTRDLEYFRQTDYALLKYVSSVNVPCFVHDGTPLGVMEALDQAKRFGCSVGAHIGYPDPAHNGYEPMEMSTDELKAWITIQMGAINAVLQTKNVEMAHVRPHGALYTAFLNNMDVAVAVCEAVQRMSQWTILVVPAGPMLAEVQKRTKLPLAPEVYLGKRYERNGELLQNRLHENLPPQAIMDQARQLAYQSALTTGGGQPIKVSFKTIHISPLLPDSAMLAERVAQMLVQPVALPLVDAGSAGWL